MAFEKKAFIRNAHRQECELINPLRGVLGSVRLFQLSETLSPEAIWLYQREDLSNSRLLFHLMLRDGDLRPRHLGYSAVA